MIFEGTVARYPNIYWKSQGFQKWFDMAKGEKVVHVNTFGWSWWMHSRIPFPSKPNTSPLGSHRSGTPDGVLLKS